MPNVDALTKILFESDEAVADVFNAVFGGGRRLIDPSMVHPASEREITLNRQGDGKWRSRERICDVVRRIQWDDTRPDRHFLLSIENQLNPHVLMPWRVMEMQGMSYNHQVRKAHWKFHNTEKTWDRVEFLSKVPRDYRFHRMVTVVIYWGTDVWDVPRQFADLLEPSPFPELLPFEPRLECPLLIPSEIPPKIIDGMEKFLKMALQYVCASNDRGRMEELLKEHSEYQSLPRNFAQGLLDMVGSQYQVDNKKETVNMCKAIEDMKKESEMQGEKRGMEEGMAKGMEEGMAKGMEEGMAKGEKKGGERMARNLVCFMRERALPDGMLQEFLVQQNFSPEQIAELCAMR